MNILIKMRTYVGGPPDGISVDVRRMASAFDGLLLTLAAPLADSALTQTIDELNNRKSDRRTLRSIERNRRERRDP